ncbi:hypothetical protein [Nocardia puris]|uniref:hypothetical protein n=1 Tax=Nocardia puris TaxID=208602 RepID=UPI0018DC054F|nr:hypothetical protein [Nocardia puris]
MLRTGRSLHRTGRALLSGLPRTRRGPRGVRWLAQGLALAGRNDAVGGRALHGDRHRLRVGVTGVRRDRHRDGRRVGPGDIRLPLLIPPHHDGLRVGPRPAVLVIGEQIDPPHHHRRVLGPGLGNLRIPLPRTPFRVLSVCVFGIRPLRTRRVRPTLTGAPGHLQTSGRCRALGSGCRVPGWGRRALGPSCRVPGRRTLDCCTAG